MDWDDSELQAKLEIASTQLFYAIFGLYGWEYIRSSQIEIALLRRQLSFRWPLLTYIAGRFSFLLAVVLLATQFSPFPTRVNCQIINTIIMFSTNVAIGCSTTNLMIRTWMIWKTSYVLRLLLVLLSLGHWTILTLFLSSARASTERGICMLGFVDPAYANASVIYSMVFDSLLLVFTVYGLGKTPSSSALWKTLVKQGVVYFLLNLIANTILLVLNSLNLNPIMNGVFGMPAACICTIASSQAVLSLLRPPPADDHDDSHLSKDATLTDQISLPVFTSTSRA